MQHRLYLKNCRVKIVEKSTFPSEKHADVKDAVGIARELIRAEMTVRISRL